MKLIIDIPEKVVTAIQNGEDYRYDIHTAIAQGIPYEDRPQVTVFAENASKEEIEDFKNELEKVLEKPRGEWIDHSEDYGYVECPFCHELTSCSDNADELHYCWSCGAKLGKGGAEE